MYTAFAAVYDRLMRDVDYTKWAAHYKRLLMQCGVPGGDICECACGTGSLTLPLRRMGYSVTGVDASGDMLSVAMRKARDAGLSIPFVRQDMCRLALHKPADAVLCTCDGLNYLLTPSRLLAFFRAAYAALKPGGALIFDLSTPYKLQYTLAANAWAQADEDVSYIWLTHYDARSRVADMRLSVFVRRPDGLYERLEETQRQRGHSMEEVTSALKQAGFGSVRFHGETALRAPREKDGRWHVRALKPRERA